MNILNKFTLINLKLNKKRTLVTIIGVSLSVALIAAVAGMIMSFRTTVIAYNKDEYGNNHALLMNIPKSEEEYVLNNNSIESIHVAASIGYSLLKDSKNESKPYLYVLGMDDDALSNNGIHLSSGRLPQNDTELIIEDSISSNALVTYHVGDTITLKIGNRYDQDDNILGQSDMYIHGIAGEDCTKDDDIYLCDTVDLTGKSETLKTTMTKTYTIVGTIDRVNDLLEEYNSPGYTVITYESHETILNSSLINYSILYRDSKKAKDNTNALLETFQNHTGREYTANYNNELLQYEGNVSNDTMSVLYGIGAIIIGIIMVTSILTTRNAFAISVSEKTKEYGMLSSIGATSKQIKKSVIFEGFLIGIVAIPCGLLLGMLATYILVWVVNYFMSDLWPNGSVLIYDMPVIVLIFDVIISAITIFLSSLIPAIKASKISPIEAIRGNNDIKMNARKLKTSKWINHAFGIGGEIAAKNLKRNKKKYRTTVISLVASITTFLTLFSFLTYGNKVVHSYYTDYTYNVSASNVQKDKINEYVSVITNSKYAVYQSVYGSVDTSIYASTFAKDNFNNIRTNSDSQLTVYLFVYNNDYFKEYLKENHFDESKYADTAFIYDNTMISHDGKYVTGHLLNDSDSITYSIDNTSYTFTNIETISNVFMGSENYKSYPLIFVSEDYMKNKNYVVSDDYRYDMVIQSDEPDNIEKSLNQVKQKNRDANTIIENIATYAKQMQNMIILVSIFLYGFIIVITLIGVTNIFNTIHTSMMLRSKEFAMLKSIGMTSKEFNQMIRLESILYGTKSLLIGIPLGLLGSYGVYRAVGQKLDFGYLIPWAGILISILFVLIIVGLIMRYSLKRVNKQNIIETIRKENI